MVSFPSSDREFSVAEEDLASLEIRSADNGTPLYYFYDLHRNRLITDFILDDRPRTRLLCEVTLIRKEEGFSPRLKLWKKDKTKSEKTAAQSDICCRRDAER
jgi:hypothetical protein